jgi:hypothetical protein
MAGRNFESLRIAFLGSARKNDMLRCRKTMFECVKSRVDKRDKRRRKFYSQKGSISDELQPSSYCLEEHVQMTEDSHDFSGEEDDTTPAASPRVSEGPQKHTIAFRSKRIYFEHKRIKNHRYQ